MTRRYFQKMWKLIGDMYKHELEKEENHSSAPTAIKEE